MGRLKPHAKYIYERADGVVYAREIGSSPADRIVIGYDAGQKEYREKVAEEQLWGNIVEESKTNSTLKDVLDSAKEIYYLSKKDVG